MSTTTTEAATTAVIDIKLLPVVDLPGSEGWAAADEWGQKLDARFPGQDAGDFAQAVANNEFGPTKDHRITSLFMIYQGENGGGGWTWFVATETGGCWVATGGCDTGWDCRSSLDWVRVPV